MHRQMRVLATLLAVCLLALVSASAVSKGEKIKSKGVITNRTGDTLIVKTSDGPYTVVLTSETKVRRPVGLGARHKQMSPEVLIPGLKMSFEGVGDDQSQIVAKTIEFESDDLALAEVIQAGLTPVAQQQARNMQVYAVDKAATEAQFAATAQEIEANRQRIAATRQSIAEVAETTNKRFAELTDWEVDTEAHVHFALGDATLTTEHQQELASLAQKAFRTKGYVIEVRGYADSTGSLAANQVLSKERAEAVVAYLLQSGVPAKNIVAPGAMSVTDPVASNETAEGRAENRRATVRILVNKAVAAS